MAKKQDTATFENKADQDVLADIEARRARGEDVFGDGDDDEQPAAQAKDEAKDEADETDGADDAAEDKQAAADEDEGDDKGEGDEQGDEKEGEQAAQGEGEQQEEQQAAADHPETPPPEFKTLSKAEFEEQRKTLRAEKNEAFKKFSAGEMTEDEYLTIQDRVDDSLMELTSQRTLLEANEQNRVNAQQTKLKQIREASKKAGLVDYETDPDAPAEFDAALQFAASLKANASLGFDALADKAHELVLQQRGLSAAPKPAPTPTPAPRQAPKAPITLSRLPAAATPNGAGGAVEQLSRLDGMDFQEAVGRMPRAQRDAWLDS